MTTFERKWKHFSAANEKAADKTDKTPQPQREEEVLSVLSVGFQDAVENTDEGARSKGIARSLIQKTRSSFTEEEVEDLLRQAEAYITLYGPLCVRCGAETHRTVIQPEALVELRLRHSSGTVADKQGELRTRWGKP